MWGLQYPVTLIKSDILFTWGPEQAKALTNIKEVLSTAPVLSYFDPTVTSTIQADASQQALEHVYYRKANLLLMPPEALILQSVTMLKLKRNCWP